MNNTTRIYCTTTTSTYPIDNCCHRRHSSVGSVVVLYCVSKDLSNYLGAQFFRLRGIVILDLDLVSGHGSMPKNELVIQILVFARGSLERYTRSDNEVGRVVGQILCRSSNHMLVNELAVIGPDHGSQIDSSQHAVRSDRGPFGGGSHYLAIECRPVHLAGDGDDHSGTRWSIGDHQALLESEFDGVEQLPFQHDRFGFCVGAHPS